MPGARDTAAGIGGLLALAAVALTALALVGFVAWGVVASGAWKPVVGFTIAAAVIAAVSIGARSSDSA